MKKFWAKKRVEKKDQSWEILAMSEAALAESKAMWPAVNQIVAETNNIAAETKRRREQNHFPELLRGIMNGGPQ